jgi:hypothetical protein
VTATLDPFVLERAPGPLIQLDPAVLRARAAVNELVAQLARVEDSALTYSWTWDGNAVDVRYAFYRGLELLEAATSALAGSMVGTASTEARDAVGAATAARWDLQGVLATLADADLDADPGGGEWTVRQTLAHITGSQRGYAWGSAYWLSVRDQPAPSGEWRAPEEIFSAMPEEADEALGSVADIRRRLDDVLDATSSRYSTLTTDEMNVVGGWSGFPVTIGFRMWRWSSHIQEHTVQVEKTLDLLGRRRSEVHYLVRLICRAFGRLESVVFGHASIGQASVVLDNVAGELRSLPESVGASLKAAVPAGEW